MSQEEITNETAEAQKTPAAATAAYEPSKGAVRNHSLSPLTGAPVSGEGTNIDLLMDVSVPVVAQLGSTEVRIREILRMAPGSIIELDKLVGEPVDLLVRGQVFAQGEVVVVDDTFGVRITQIVGQPNSSENAG
jgi:flagellar motor switch protein FliN/FliY